MDKIKKYEPLWGEWKVKREIGEGSYGTVYEVEKTLLGNTSYSAVKLISFHNSEMLRGFKMDETISAETLEAIKMEAAKKNVREAALMDKLQGRTNIVTIYDYGIYPNEKTTDVLIRMELLTNLWEYIDTVEVNTDFVIKLGMDICRALECCEEEKIVHRDIKPDNIFVNKDKDFKLGDFGLSRKMNKSASVSLKKSKGTPMYMSPEAFGWGQHVDQTSDIYSLGIVMYQLLNDGNIPFSTTKDDFEDEDNAIGRRLDGEEFEAPAHEKGKLWGIIQKACRFQKKERYQSASEMRKDLEKLKNVRNKTSEIKTEETRQGKTSSSFYSSFSIDNILGKAQKAWNEDKFEEAFYLYEKAARLGSAEGQNALGYCYYTGYGTDMDEKKALHWFDKAAAQGHVSANDTARKLRQQLEEEMILPKKEKKSEKLPVLRVSEQEKTVRTYNVGDSLTFGTYMQDKDSSVGKRPIEWIVLKKEMDKMLVISKYVLDSRPYHDELYGRIQDDDCKGESVTWETSDIRRWLNDSFYEEVFNAEERARIPKTLVEAHWTINLKDPGNDTRDRVFLLSSYELFHLPGDESSLEEILHCMPTEYAVSQGVYCDNDTPYTSWWLRSPGNDKNCVEYVLDDFVVEAGGDVEMNEGIRPAMWISYEPINC